MSAVERLIEGLRQDAATARKHAGMTQLNMATRAGRNVLAQTTSAIADRLEEAAAKDADRLAKLEARLEALTERLDLLDAEVGYAVSEMRAALEADSEAFAPGDDS